MTHRSSATLVLIIVAILAAWTARPAAAVPSAGGQPHSLVAPSLDDPIFADVPPTHPYFAEIEALYQAGYTAGCNTDPLMYCPDQTMNRAESSVFVERGIHTASYDPPSPSSQVFADMPLDSWAAKWVNGLWDDRYTAGCGTDPLLYCPWQGHTRAEGCVFYLRMVHGADYVPPEPTEPLFVDVPLDAWFAKWVHSAYEAGLLMPCETSPQMRYCPDDPLSRALAAHMMVRAKGLLVPTPTASASPAPTRTATATASQTPRPTTPTPTPTRTMPPTGQALVADHVAVGQFDQIPRSAIDAAAGKITLFMRQSTGGIIEGSGLGCLAGLEWDPNYGYPPECAIYKNNRETGGWPWYDNSNWSWDLWPSPQADAMAKTDQFVSVVNARAGNYQVIGMKFCYVDGWNQSENVAYNNNHGYYITQMEALEQQYPGKVFIYATSALWADPGGACGGAFDSCQQTAEFNQQVRAYARANNKPLYDMADIESHDRNGNPCTVSGYEGMCADWYEGGGGHPNTEGAIRLAKGFWWLMARIAGWNAP